MKSTQFFYQSSAESLQVAVNAWLADHPEIHILQSNLVATPTPASGQDGDVIAYTFYILYEGPGHGTMKAEASLKETIPEVTDEAVKKLDIPGIGGVSV